MKEIKSFKLIGLALITGTSLLTIVALLLALYPTKVYGADGCSATVRLRIPPGFTNLPSGHITCWNTNGAIFHDQIWSNPYFTVTTGVSFCEGDWLNAELPGLRCANGDCNIAIMSCTTPANPGPPITHENVTAPIPDGSHAAVFILHKLCNDTTCGVSAELTDWDSWCSQQ